MVDSERRLGQQQGELLRGQELYAREQKAVKPILGVEVPVRPLPEFIAPEVQRNLVELELGLRYIPALDLGSLEDLKAKGVDRYLVELQQKYPKWREASSLSANERKDYRVPVNLDRAYWKAIEKGEVDFPVLPGQWTAVELVEKPDEGEDYRKTPLAEKLGFGGGYDRFFVPWENVQTAMKRERQGILDEIGLSGQPVDMRLLEIVEWNLLGNREGWGKTNTFEYTNTPWRLHPNPLDVDPSEEILIVGSNYDDRDGIVNGAGMISAAKPNPPIHNYERIRRSLRRANVGLRVGLFFGS